MLMACFNHILVTWISAVLAGMTVTFMIGGEFNFIGRST